MGIQIQPGTRCQSYIEKFRRMRPQLEMGSNQTCWCFSEKAWSLCHKDREKLPKVHSRKIKKEEDKEFLKGRCLHPNADENFKTINSHSVQENGVLFTISDEENKVFSVVDSLREYRHSDIGQKFKLIRKGIRSEASLFPGFCKKHDSDFFNPVEGKSIDFNDYHSYLFSYRAMSYELQRREKLIDVYKVKRQFDAGYDFNNQVDWQRRVNATIIQESIMLDYLEDWKMSLDERYNSGEMSESYFLAEFDQLLPFAACGAFMPLVDFQGNVYEQSLTEFISVNVVCYENKSKLIISFFGDKEGYAQKFVESFMKLKKIEMANAALHMCLEHLENVYIQPSWWVDLSKLSQSVLEKRMHHGTKPSSDNERINPSDAFLSMPKILTTRSDPKLSYFEKQSTV